MHAIALCVLHVVRPRTSLALILRSKILQHSSLKTIWGRSIAERGPKLLGRSACATIEKTPARRQRASTTNAKALDISAVSRHSGCSGRFFLPREGAGLVTIVCVTFLGDNGQPCFPGRRCAACRPITTTSGICRAVCARSTMHRPPSMPRSQAPRMRWPSGMKRAGTGMLEIVTRPRTLYPSKVEKIFSKTRKVSV